LERLLTGRILGLWLAAQQQGTGATQRVYISYVFPSTQAGFAATAGILRGDEILSVDGNAVNSSSSTVQDAVDQATQPERRGKHHIHHPPGGRREHPQR